VLVNLLGNAVKFTKEGEIGIKVYSEKEAQEDGVVALRIHVVDTGIGIPRDKRDALFQPFSQVDGSITRKYGGTGLGLSICKAIVSAFNGAIWIESEEAKGSAFIFTLKLKPGDQKGTLGIYPLSLQELKGKKVVIVDDRQVNRELVQYYCEGAGMDIRGVYEKPLLAVESISRMIGENSAPDVILSDLMMAEMDGNQLAQSVKKLQNIKIIVVTSDARIGTAQEAQNFGFDGYIPKPFSRDQFYKIIATVLGDKRKAGAIVTRHMAEEVSCKGIRILIAEDDIVNSMLMKEYMRVLQCECDFVVNGQEVIDKLRERAYDLCLLDVQMPVMDGLEAVEIIRKEISKDFPVIALSAAAMEEDREKGRLAGMTDYLTKPINVEELRVCIARYGRKF
jgi:CheY-like chemotaxis protein